MVLSVPLPAPRGPPGRPHRCRYPRREAESSALRLPRTLPPRSKPSPSPGAAGTALHGPSRGTKPLREHGRHQRGPDTTRPTSAGALQQHPEPSVHRLLATKEQRSQLVESLLPLVRSLVMRAFIGQHLSRYSCINKRRPDLNGRCGWCHFSRGREDEGGFYSPASQRGENKRRVSGAKGKVLPRRARATHPPPPGRRYGAP